MFSKKRKQQDRATQKRLGIAVPPQHPVAWPAHERTTSAASNALPPVSPLPLTPDVDMPPSPAISVNSALLPGTDGELRPQTADGVARKRGRSPINMVPPITSATAMKTRETQLELEGSYPGTAPRPRMIEQSAPPPLAPPALPPPPPPPPPPLETPTGARFDSDNFSTSSSKSRRKSRFKNFFGYEQPPELGAASRPSSSPGTPIIPPLNNVPSDPAPQPITGGSGSIQMESSLFPPKAKSPPVLPPFDNDTPVMTRAWLDARDKPYTSAPKRPPMLQATQSTPDLTLNVRSPSINFSKRTPIAPASPVVSSRPSDIPAPSRSLSETPSGVSASTARTGASSKTPAATESPSTLTVGTPYQETSPAFPLPQHVTTRPKTAGAPTSTLAGVTVPTHHTSSLAQPRDKPIKLTDPKPQRAEKSDRRMTRLLNPMALLSRRKSAQDEQSLEAQKTAQQLALARQKNVAAHGGISRLPDDYDPRIRGSGVHDFNAPRQPTRVYSSNDMPFTLSPQPSVSSSRRALQTADSAPHIPGVPRQNDGKEERRGPKLTFVGQSFSTTNRWPSPDSGASARRRTGFQEHLGDDTTPLGGIRAERLENKDFVQRASYFSQNSSVASSSESAVLPIFARRSQHWDENAGSKRGSDAADQRHSGISSVSAISPVVAGMAGTYDNRASPSPISPRSDMRDSKVGSERGSGIRPVSGVSSKERVKSSAGISLTGTVSSRPFSSESTGLHSADPPFEDTQDHSSRPPMSISIPIPPGRSPPEIPPPGRPPGGVSPMSPGFDLPSDAPTPEPQVADSVLHLQAPTSPPKLVEKRASAVGHSSRRPMDSGLPRHHASNASRFSFQLGGGRAEEEALEEKARRLRSNGEGVGNTLGDEDEDEDVFDEDAMDDLDEMEIQANTQTLVDFPPIPQSLPATQNPVTPQHQRPESAASAFTTNSSRNQGRVSQFLYRPATTNATAKRSRASALELRIDEYDSGESEEEEETPYWMHEDFMGYDTEQSRHTSVAEGMPGVTAITAAEGLRSRAMSASSGLTLDTSVGLNNLVSAGAPTVTTGHQEPPPPPQQQQRQQVSGSPARQSGRSEKHRTPSSTTLMTTEATNPEQKTQHTPAMSSSTLGGSSSSEPRTISTGLALSGFSDFRFSDSTTSTRPTSFQTDGLNHESASKGNRRTTDSMTIPHDVDWTAESNHASPSMKLNARSSDGWEERPGASGPGARELNVRRASSPLVTAKPRGLSDEGDKFYFDDGGFDQDVNGVLPRTSGDAVDESAFDDDNFLARNGNVGTGQAVKPAPPKVQVHHQRDTSAMTITSLGSDGPYPSFAIPNPIKARQRDSQLLLEDLPSHAGPVDPKLIPRRNPSEDAKRLGLSSRAPPLPPQPGSQEALRNTQARMQAYHAALAETVNRAAAEGRFIRAPSNKSTTATSLNVPEDSSSTNDRSPQPSATSVYSREDDGGQVAEADEPPQQKESQDPTFSQLDMFGTNYSPPTLSFDFGFDSMQADGGVDEDEYDAFLDDEDIIAAANAEALANDDQGFYGQEFGFYAKARPNSGDLEAINGGYFGPDGDDGLTRNRSLKEPNLTPITERSEFSTRNSFIGAFGPASAGPHSATTLGSGLSPALARMPFSPLGEDEVASFDQLRQLKARAFGGSNASLQSDNRRGSQSSLLQMANAESPTLSGRSSAAGTHGYFGMGGAPIGLGYSTDSSGSSNVAPQQQQNQAANTDSPHSATSNSSMQFGNAESDATPKKTTQSTNEPPTTARKISIPVAALSSNKAAHSRTSSGADSVTYVQEQSPEGVPRWVLERRRTSEQGQLELVAREVVQGGWI